MLTLIALSATLMQEPPAPAAPPAPPERHTRFMVMGGDGPGGLDKDGDGQITREEFAAPLTDHFTRMDKDGDGRLSTEELTAGHGATAEDGAHNVMIMRGPGGPGGPGVRRFQLRRSGEDGAHAGHGEDGDHEVRIITVAGADGHEGPGARRFVLRGEDGARVEHGEGRIMDFIGGEPGAGGERRIVIRGGPGGTATAWTGVHAEGGPGERIEIRRVGGPGGENDLDTDNDGRISEAEFSAPLREAFARMDADRSGFIEESERTGGSEVFVHRIETRQNRED